MREGNKEIQVVENVIDYDEINRKIWLNNITVGQRPVLTISSWCHNHIKALHKQYPSTEWLALCKIENLWDWQFEMVDMIHPQQKWVGWEVETTDDWMDWAVDYLIEKGEDLSKWNCVLHSHHSMGCFWSHTDDNARLGLNDWRTLAWAVVSAYKWEEIDYKGCVNFYKPYPIEIDCDIEYYTEDLYWQYEEWGDFVKGKTQEIYNEKVKTDERLKELECDYDYSFILNYLWIDISQELKENAKEIIMKMPCPEYEERLKEIKEEAEKEAQEEIGTPIDNEVIQWKEWSDNLLEQLDKARDIPYTSKIYNPSGCFSRVYNDEPIDYSNNWATVEKKQGVSDYDNEYRRYKQFNKDNYPTAEDLISEWWFNQFIKLRANEAWEWEVYNKSYNMREYVGDCYEELYWYVEDYL